MTVELLIVTRRLPLIQLKRFAPIIITPLVTILDGEQKYPSLANVCVKVNIDQRDKNSYDDLIKIQKYHASSQCPFDKNQIILQLSKLSPEFNNQHGFQSI